MFLNYFALICSCHWDDRKIRRSIGDGKLAARLKGKDDRESGMEQECPICFLQYDEINTLQCCKAPICTECYLQVQSPRGEHNTSSCPFCNKPQMSVVVAKRLDVHDVAKREEEELRISEATVRARTSSEASSKSMQSSPGEISNLEGFGARLNEEMKRTRSKSLCDDHLDESTLNIGSLALTPEERHTIENQMRSQLSHPLVQEMQRNAEIESQRHLTEHAERRRERVRSSREQLERLIDRARTRERGLHMLTGIPGHDDDEFDMTGSPDSDGNRQGRPNVEDLYLLEAAIYLSARDDAMRRRGNRGRSRRSRNNQALLRALLSGGDEVAIGENVENNENGNNSQTRESNGGSDIRRGALSPSDVLIAGLSEDNQLAMAIQMSLREAEEREQQQDQQDDDGSANNDGQETNADTTE
jgi:hypothetical protein